MTDFHVLDILLHCQPIGTITLLAGDQSVFAFDQAYILDRERRTLSLSFKDTMGGLITDVKPTRVRVPPFFANLLPEGPMREYLAERAGVHPRREFFLLSVLGHDLPGAVTVKDSHRDTSRPVGRAGSGSARVSPRRGALHFSLAGVQLKFSAIAAADGGLTIPASGMGGSWIVKLPSTRFPRVPENEFAMMGLARAVGIDIPETRLVRTQDVTGLPEDIGRLERWTLAVRRFDRLDSGASVHIEDFAQIFGVYPEDKYRRASYRNLAQVLQAEVGTDAIQEFVRRLVFSALIGNADMHLKNWSLLYPDGRSATLAPAYDFVSTIPYIDDPNMALNLYKPGTKRMTDLSFDSLARLAAKARLSERAVLSAARETVARFREVWGGGHGHEHLPDFVAKSINDHYRSLAIAAGVRDHR